jgi:O-antigen/teichoic acid export membrane protein
MISPMNIGMLKPGRSHYNIVPLVFGAGAGLACAFLLVPRYGLIAAAVARIICILTSLGLIIFFSQSFHPVRFPYARMAILLCVSALLSAIMSSQLLAGWTIVLKLGVFTVSILSILMVFLLGDAKLQIDPQY